MAPHSRQQQHREQQNVACDTQSSNVIEFRASGSPTTAAAAAPGRFQIGALLVLGLGLLGSVVILLYRQQQPKQHLDERLMGHPEVLRDPWVTVPAAPRPSMLTPRSPYLKKDKTLYDRDPIVAKSNPSLQEAKLLHRVASSCDDSGQLPPGSSTTKQAIPHILHQNYLSGLAALEQHSRAERTHFRREWRLSCRTHHPSWRHIFWDRDAAERLLSSRYPWFLTVWRNYSSLVMQSDALRPFILHAYGGVYLDLDTECFRPMDSSLLGYDLVLMAEEPDLANNAQMASVPSHPLWELVMQHLKRNAAAGLSDPLYSTGPRVITAAFRELFEYPSGPLPGQHRLLRPATGNPSSEHAIDPWVNVPGPPSSDSVRGDFAKVTGTSSQRFRGRPGDLGKEEKEKVEGSRVPLDYSGIYYSNGDGNAAMRISDGSVGSIEISVAMIYGPRQWFHPCAWNDTPCHQAVSLVTPLLHLGPVEAAAVMAAAARNATYDIDQTRLGTDDTAEVSRGSQLCDHAAGKSAVSGDGWHAAIPSQFGSSWSLLSQLDVVGEHHFSGSWLGFDGSKAERSRSWVTQGLSRYFTDARLFLEDFCCDKGTAANTTTALAAETQRGGSICLDSSYFYPNDPRVGPLSGRNCRWSEAVACSAAKWYQTESTLTHGTFYRMNAHGAATGAQPASPAQRLQEPQPAPASLNSEQLLPQPQPQPQPQPRHDVPSGMGTHPNESVSKRDCTSPCTVLYVRRQKQHQRQNLQQLENMLAQDCGCIVHLLELEPEPEEHLYNEHGEAKGHEPKVHTFTGTGRIFLHDIRRLEVPREGTTARTEGKGFKTQIAVPQAAPKPPWLVPATSSPMSMPQLFDQKPYQQQLPQPGVIQGSLHLSTSVLSGVQKFKFTGALLEALMAAASARAAPITTADLLVLDCDSCSWDLVQDLYNSEIRLLDHICALLLVDLPPVPWTRPEILYEMYELLYQIHGFVGFAHEFTSSQADKCDEALPGGLTLGFRRRKGVEHEMK